MADTGAKAPTTTGTPSNQWTNSTDAYASGGGTAYYQAPGAGGNAHQSYKTFGFGVPVGATIDGIEIVASTMITDSEGNNNAWRVFVYSASAGGPQFKAISDHASLTADTFGGATDKWGTTWVADDFSDANFYADFYGNSASDSVGAKYEVDYFTVKVYYTEAVPSASMSPSSSSSASLSPSSSSSASLSPSSSSSKSLSPSSSSSASLSPSASPSYGFQDYTRGNYAALPANNNDLETAYSAQDITDVATKNDVRVSQDATGEYAIHQYKNFTTATSTNLEWEGQTNCACWLSPVVLQIYRVSDTTWEEIDRDDTTAADTDFTLNATIADLTNYRTAGIVTCRIYQQGL
jgi:hypothetical protein